MASNPITKETEEKAPKRKANKRPLLTIAGVCCPDTCTCTDKGCYFREGPDAFKCTKCHLRIWRHFMGYELTPTDLDEMLHGARITAEAKTLHYADKVTKEPKTLQARLIFDEEYRIKLAPKLKGKTATEEKCPKCNTGVLMLLTDHDDNRWFGCSAYPNCRFKRPFLPHKFIRQETNTTPEVKVVMVNDSTRANGLCPEASQLEGETVQQKPAKAASVDCAVEQIGEKLPSAVPADQANQRIGADPAEIEEPGEIPQSAIQIDANPMQAQRAQCEKRAESQETNDQRPNNDTSSSAEGKTIPAFVRTVWKNDWVGIREI